jgi:serine/threonine-protein phosphatase 5
MPRDHCKRCVFILLHILHGPYECLILGGCEVEKSYKGPKLEFSDNKYHITQQFILDMMEWFKGGQSLPRRYVWEIALGAYSYLKNEESLVSLDLQGDMDCDVIGDVHGTFEMP